MVLVKMNRYEEAFKELHLIMDIQINRLVYQGLVLNYTVGFVKFFIMPYYIFNFSTIKPKVKLH